MTSQEEAFDDPTGWVARHIRTCVETDRAQGHRWNGVHTLLLTARGRKSGNLPRTAPICGRDGDRCVVVVPKGGAESSAHGPRPPRPKRSPGSGG